MSPHRARDAHILRAPIGLVSLTLIGSILALAAGAEKKPATRDAVLSGFVRAELLNRETDPTFRFPVMHWFGSIWSVTYGWLDISRDSVRYQVQQAENKRDHSFTSSRRGVVKMKWQGYWLNFQAAGKDRHIVYLPPERWGTVHTGFGMNSAGAENQAFTRGIQDTLQSFEHVLASMPPPPVVPPKPEPAPAPPAAPPPTATPAKRAEPAPASATPPTIVMTQPSVGSSGETLEVAGPTLTVRGIATDASSLPIVTINGLPANMKPRSAQVVEFWSDPVKLTPGHNVFEIMAANSAKLKSSFRFVAQHAPPPPQPPPTAAPAPAPAKPQPPAIAKGLTKAEILDLLNNYVSSARVAALVRERGIKFQPKPADLDEITAAGGAEDLLEAVKTAGQAANPPS